MKYLFFMLIPFSMIHTDELKESKNFRTYKYNDHTYVVFDLHFICMVHDPDCKCMKDNK